MEELKRCPFCGSDVEMRVRIMADAYEDCVFSGLWSIKCPQCLHVSKTALGRYGLGEDGNLLTFEDGRKIVLLAWNERAE